MNPWIETIMISILITCLPNISLFAQDSLISTQTIVVTYKKNKVCLVNSEKKKFDTLIAVLKKHEDYGVIIKIENELKFTESKKVNLYNQRLECIRVLLNINNIDDRKILLNRAAPSQFITVEQINKASEYRKENINLETRPFYISIFTYKW